MSQPNILLLLTDDQRHDTIGALGNDRVNTPHMDALVERGCAFERCHIMGGTSGAVCCPSRAMLHTGRGLFHLEGVGHQIPEDHTTMGEHFQAHGYETFGIGKWHNGKPAYARSFTDGGMIYFGGMADHWNVPAHPFDPTGAYDGDPKMCWGNHSTTRGAQNAIDLLRKRDESKPFFMSVAFLAPHDPRTMPEEFLAPHLEDLPPLPENFAPEHPFDNGELSIRDELLADLPRIPQQVRRHIAEYYGMIDHLDHAIGRIFAELDRLGLTDDTIVILSGDNGLAVGQHGLMGKQSCYDHSLRVPLVLAGPGIPEGAKRRQFCYLHDLFPTLCEATGTPVPGSVNSRSYWSTVTGDAPHRDALFCGYRHLMRTVTREDGWKFIVTAPGDGSYHEQLFHLPDDPMEMDDRSTDPACAEIRAELMERLKRDMIEAEDPHRSAILPA